MFSTSFIIHNKISLDNKLYVHNTSAQQNKIYTLEHQTSLHSQIKIAVRKIVNLKYYLAICIQNLIQ